MCYCRTGGEGGAAVLPLKKDVKKIALIGPLADDTGEMMGAWGLTKREPDVVTVKDALEQRMKQAGGSLLYAKGTEISGDSDAGFAEAVENAKQADVVVMALGESSEMSGEAGSRAYLDLPGNQEKLLEQVAAAGKPVVLLVFSGRPLVLDWAAEACARNHGSMVSGNGGGKCDCRFAVRRCCAERETADELSARSWDRSRSTTTSFRPGGRRWVSILLSRRVEIRGSSRAM